MAEEVSWLGKMSDRYEGMPGEYIETKTSFTANTDSEASIPETQQDLISKHVDDEVVPSHRSQRFKKSAGLVGALLLLGGAIAYGLTRGDNNTTPKEETTPAAVPVDGLTNTCSNPPGQFLQEGIYSGSKNQVSQVEKELFGKGGILSGNKVCIPTLALFKTVIVDPATQGNFVKTSQNYSSDFKNNLNILSQPGNAALKVAKKDVQQLYQVMSETLSYDGNVTVKGGSLVAFTPEYGQHGAVDGMKLVKQQYVANVALSAVQSKAPENAVQLGINAYTPIDILANGKVMATGISVIGGASNVNKVTNKQAGKGGTEGTSQQPTQANAPKGTSHTNNIGNAPESKPGNLPTPSGGVTGKGTVPEKNPGNAQGPSPTTTIPQPSPTTTIPPQPSPTTTPQPSPTTTIPHNVYKAPMPNTPGIPSAGSGATSNPFSTEMANVFVDTSKYIRSK